MRDRTAALLVLAVLGVLAVTFVVVRRGRTNPNAAAAGQLAQQSRAGREPIPPSGSTPVAANRGPEVLDAFRGEVHPLLTGQTRLEVAARWTPVGKGRDHLHRDLNPKIYSWFTELRPAVPVRTYTEHDLSGFLPEALGEVGQTWALDADKMLAILKQFHPRPSVHLVASGRRAGPDGAYAILRAVSPAYLDIAFRVHAEFYLTPDDWPANAPLIRAWYTPAYFSGNVLVNRRTGTVDYFRLGLGADKALNVHLTVEAKGVGDTRQAHDIVRVECMELAGGDGGPAEKAAWTKALTPAEADGRLANVFYKFLKIDWLPFDRVLAEARARGRPIFAIVSWGAFDDQSC